MTKSEALEFLELPETATDSEIKIRVEDKLAYFERLSEKAPSDFLKRLHARNAAKVSEIQLLSKKWPSYVPPVEEAAVSVTSPAVTPEVTVTPEAVAMTPLAFTPEVAVTPEPVITVESAVSSAADAVLEAEAAVTPEVKTKSEPVVTPETTSTPESESVKGNEPIILTPEPVGAVELALTPLVQPEVVVKPEAVAEARVVVEDAVKPAAATVTTPVAATPTESVPVAATEPVPVAWLIRHTENQSARTFPIYPGKNYLGRKPRPDLVPFIEVEEDPYISKVHAVFFADKASVYISDPSGGEGKPSKNGIYLNADDNRLKETTRLKEHDTVQIGVTKLILRYNNQTIGKIVQEVQEQDYMHTVVIDIS